MKLGRRHKGHKGRVRVLNVKALVGTFNQEKALVVAFSVITSLCVDLRFKLYFVTLLLSSQV